MAATGANADLTKHPGQGHTKDTVGMIGTESVLLPMEGLDQNLQEHCIIFVFLPSDVFA